MKYTEDEQLSLKLVLVTARMMSSVGKATENKLNSYGLTTTEFDVLEVLFTKGELPLKELSEKMLMANGSITYVVNKLEQRGLLKRVPNKKDRRINDTGLTEEGYLFFEEIFKDFVPFNKDLFEVLSSEEKKLFIEMAKKVGKSIDQA